MSIVLHDYAKTGDFNAVKQIFDDLPLDCLRFVAEDVLKKNTVLLDACEAGNVDLVRYLVNDVGANVWAKINNDPMSIHIAAKKNHLEVVKILCEADRNLAEAREYLNFTPLHNAARMGSMDVVRYLVDEMKVEVDPKSDIDSTPLFLAAENGKVDVVRFLVENGADFKAAQDGGWSPIHIAAEKGHVEVIRFLVSLDLGLVNSKEEVNDETPLVIAAGEGRVEVVKFLLEVGAEINAADLYGLTALMKASQSGSLPIVQALIEKGADPARFSRIFPYKQTLSALHLAAKNGRVEVVKYLAELRPDLVHLKNNKGETPKTFCFSSSNCSEMLKYLDYNRSSRK